MCGQRARLRDLFHSNAPPCLLPAFYHDVRSLVGLEGPERLPSLYGLARGFGVPYVREGSVRDGLFPSPLPCTYEPPPPIAAGNRLPVTATGMVPAAGRRWEYPPSECTCWYQRLRSLPAGCASSFTSSIERPERAWAATISLSR